MTGPARTGLSAWQPLDAELHADEYGGKAAALSRMLRAGLPVPPGFALAARVPAGSPLPDSAAVRGPVAVRSSAIGEDGAGASFAGQHLTRLGVVGTAAVADAVAAVRASAGAAHARRYRERVAVAGETPRMGVVVQSMVDAACSGVLFTRDPVSGAGECIIEAVYGLGEMLVSGAAAPARWRLSPDGRVLDFCPGTQKEVLRLRPDGRVHRYARDPVVVEADCLDSSALAALVALAARCAAHFGGPQDIEWAICRGSIWLLQSRPVTTLQAAVPPAAAEGVNLAQGNELHDDPGDEILWTRVNIAEAVPGTVTPLTAGFHRDSFDLSPQRMFARMGVMPARTPRRPRSPQERPSAFVCGRAVANVDFLRDMADAIPGSSGDALEEAMFGRVRPGMVSRPRRGRYPVVLIKLLWIVATLPRRLERLHAQTHAWWRQGLVALATANLPRTVDIFEHACVRYARIIEDQGLIAALSAGFWNPLARIVRRIGTDDDLLCLTAGYGTVREAHMLQQLWEVAHGRQTLECFLGQWGYMAPRAGELAAESWRENRDGLLHTLTGYREQAPDQCPAARQDRAQREFHAARRRLRRRARMADRIALDIALWLAGRMLPVREIGKASMVIGTDVARVAARRAGELLVQRGDIDAPDDVLYYTRAELRAAVRGPGDGRAQVRARKALRAHYEALPVPDFFTGRDLRTRIAAGVVPEDADPAAATSIRAVGVSRGRVRGIARVIADPAQAMRLGPGEILVCHMTDPAWSALFSIAGGLVVDIGGMLSHAAIIAREIGIPAVVNTRDGTQRIPDGAEIEVDGGLGTVRILGAGTQS